MNNCIFNNLKVLKPNDKLYFLGDLAFGKHNVISTLNFIKNLGVELHYILGNHDKKYKNIIKNYCTTLKYYDEIKINNIFIIMFHYPIENWNGKFHNSISIHGHTHGTALKIQNRMDIGVDNNDFYPVSFEKLKKTMATKKQHHVITKDGERIYEGNSYTS